MFIEQPILLKILIKISCNKMYLYKLCMGPDPINVHNLTSKIWLISLTFKLRQITTIFTVYIKTYFFIVMTLKMFVNKPIQIFNYFCPSFPGYFTYLKYQKTVLCFHLDGLSLQYHYQFHLLCSFVFILLNFCFMALMLSVWGFAFSL